MNAPQWWFWATGLFCVVGLLCFLATIYIALKVLQIVKSIQPMVERTAQRVEETSKKVEALADAAQHTVSALGGSVRNVAGSLESVVVTGARRFESVAGVLMMAMAGIKLYRQFAALRRGHEEDEEPVEA